MGRHFHIGPSSRSRWSRCPGQPALLEAMKADGFDPGTTDAAEEGTLCHEIAALMLTSEFTVGAAAYDGATEELAELVDSYVDRARTDIKDADNVWIEEELDLSEAYGLAGAFGTGDLGWTKGTTLYVRDAKFGRVAVNAKGNDQLVAYGLGFLDYCRMLGIEIDRVVLSIDQPRNGGLSEWEMSAADLDREREWLQAQVAATQDEHAPLVPGPVQCPNCSCLTECPKVKELAYETRRYATHEEGPEQYSTAVVLAGWAKRVIDGTKKAMEAGYELEGYKLIKARASAAKWLPAASEQLVDAFDAETIYKPKELKTPAQLRKEIGKDETGQKLIDKVSRRGAPSTAIVPETDGRPAITRDDPMSDFDEV